MALRQCAVLSFALGLAFAGAPGALAHGTGGDETRLRAVETAQLGADHAAAHARQRELARRAGPPAPLRAAAVIAPPGPPDGAGQGAAAVPIPVLAINVAMLPTGKVLIFAYPNRPGKGEADYALAFLWDPVTRESKAIPPPIDPSTGKPTNIWCAGTSFLADGRVLVAGGNIDDPLVDFHGLPTIFTFDPFTETWQTHPSMRQGRWYPSQLLMPNGRTVILGGLTRTGEPDNGGTNLDLEVFYPESRTRLVADFRLGEPGRPPGPGLYPHMFWMPDGRALVAGPQPQDSWYLAPPQVGVPTTWADIPDMNAYREFGTAVMLDGARILELGGSALDADGDKRRPAVSTTEVFDPSVANPAWQPGPEMAVPRSHANSVILPDGTIATFGGGYGEDGNMEFYRWLYDPALHTRVELLDPETGHVELGPAQTEARTYHSTALLLPDGRVMSAGDDINGSGGPGTGYHDDTAELYSPPYLFRGPRPRLTDAPGLVEYGAQFEVTSPEAATVTSAVLVAPGAVTHNTDMNQRRVSLSIVARRPGELDLLAPADPNRAPPGYYMLFLLNSSGVPSVAKWVRLPVPPQPPEVEPTPVPTVTPTPAPAPIVEPPAPARLSVKITPRRLRTLLRTRVLTVGVRLTGPGFVTVAASYEDGPRRSRGLTRAGSVRFAGVGARRVNLRLSAAAVKRLAARRRVYVRVRATARTGAGALRATARSLAR